MRFLLALAFLLMLALPAQAAPDLPTVGMLESYLNGLTTLQSRFVQTANDGKQATGIFMLKRPGRLRFEYDAPIEDFIVADGTMIYYYDSQMKQQSSAPITKSLADFFLRPDLKLSGDISVSEIKRLDDLVQLTLLQTRDPQAGSLTIMFSENPLQIKKWRIVDTQGAVTTVELYETQNGVALNSKLFHYTPPENKKFNINK